MRYKSAFRRGERVRTAHCGINRQSVDQLAFLPKKQPMAWTKAGAQALLHVKTAVLNGALHRYTQHIEAPAACRLTDGFFMIS